MLGRASSNSRLRRSKSSASVKSRRQTPSIPEPLDPRAARHHALTAASLAMGGYQQQHSPSRSGGSADQSRERDAESPAYLRRRHTARTAGSGSSATSRSLGAPRSQTPLRNLPTREGSLEPVPEQPIQTKEFAFLEDSNTPSAPSSYRRLRKSKSMFATRLRDQRQSPQKDDTCAGVPADGFSRNTLRRSLSFFKEKREAAHSRNGYSESSDVAVQLARDQFLQDLPLQQGSVASDAGSDKPNQFQQRPFRKFRKSLRSISTDEDPISGIVANSRDPDSKSKSLSTSIKRGFRRLFGRSSASQGRKSFSSMVSSPLRATGTESSPSSSATVIDRSQRAGRPPASSPQRQLEKGETSTVRRPASLQTVKSSGSVSSSTSRVSSWADSTAANTITTRHGGLDQSQLPATGKNTERAPSVRSHHGGHSVSQEPLQYGRPGSRAKENFDSERVYSALMRHIDQTNAARGTGNDVTPKPAKAKNSRHTTPGPALSIRHIPSATSVSHSISPSTARVTPDVRGQLPAEDLQYRRNPLALTPQQVAHYNEGIDRHSRRQSPYVSQSTRVVDSPVQPGTPTPYGRTHTSSRHQVLGSEDDSSTIIVNRPAMSSVAPQSPSVYSRTTSGVSLCVDESDQSGSEDDRGTATILANHRVEYSPRRKISGRNWDRVTKGSAEWKQWMSSQMDIINSSPAPISFPNHYREDAQINDDGFQPVSYTGGYSNESRGHSQPGLEDLETTRPPLVELPSQSQNNFSRPLRRPPSGPISIRNTSVRKPSITTADNNSPAATVIINNTGARSCSSKGPSPSRSPSKTPNGSPLLVHKTGSPGHTTTPEKDIQRNRNTSFLRSRLGQYQTSPLMPGRMKEENVDLSKENQALHDDNTLPRRKNTENNLAKLENIHSTIGSKRMVDIFLSDRRRLMGSSEDDEAMGAEPAFL